MAEIPLKRHKSPIQPTNNQPKVKTIYHWKLQHTTTSLSKISRSAGEDMYQTWEFYLELTTKKKDLAFVRRKTNTYERYYVPQSLKYTLSSCYGVQALIQEFSSGGGGGVQPSEKNLTSKKQKTKKKTTGRALQFLFCISMVEI